MLKNKKIKIFAIFIITFFSLALILFHFTKKEMIQKKEKYKYIAINHSNIITGYLNTVMARIYTVKALAINEKGEIINFNKIANAITEEAHISSGVNIRNIAIAPKGIVSNIYPLKNNEKFLGFNFLDSTKPGNSYAIESYKTNKFLITEPFNFIQGGQGIGGRLPIYNNSDFWGIITLTLDLDNVLKIIGLNIFNENNISYELSYLSQDKSYKIIAASDKKVISPVSFNFNLHNLKWNIKLSPENGWVNYYEIIFDLLFALIFAGFLSLIFLNKEKITDINKYLEKISIIDPLTGVFSRQYITKFIVKGETEKWINPSQKYSMAIIDIDLFKEINDNYGHDFGDIVLTAVAIEFKKFTDKDDCIIRFGGDEFIILFSSIDKIKFKKILNNLKNHINSLNFEKKEVKISISIGGTSYEEANNLSFKELFKLTDAKLYKAKKEGRNKVII
ncbi:MAG: diguanylate cyclase [Fusobacterium sp. JB021]|nr:diguanylate cyclase [Fusobacterium sp. JB021]MDP0506250.1 diguanylate cyclase [Fusobacterium sp. JB019]